MTKRVQLAGGDRKSQDSFVGFDREVTVDVTNYDLRLHDGVTPGGRRILNVDNGDARWQGRANELDGLTGFLPTDLGILVRVGPADYAFRQLVVNTENLQIVNPAGQAGNPILALASVIASDHTFTGDIISTSLWVATGGIKGNLEGDVAGDLVGNSTGTHTGNVIGNVLGNAAGDHTGSMTGDVDVRGFTVQFDDGQIPVQALGADFDDLIARISPRGMIVMWSGFIEDIPDGFLLCDGTLGTPDLRDRFVVGAGGTYFEFDTGGDATPDISGTTDSAGTHSHVVTVTPTALTEEQMPLHSHRSGYADDQIQSTRFVYGAELLSSPLPKSVDDGGDPANAQGFTSEEGAGDPHTHIASAATAGSHTHPITIVAAPTIPPYYALAFIQKGF